MADKVAEEEAKQKELLNNTLKEYIAEWRSTREKEEEELKKLKEKQAKRKEIRAEQEKKLNQAKKEEEEKLRKEDADKRAAEADEKKKRLEEAEAKRQEMLEGQKAEKAGSKKSVAGNDGGDARKEMTKTKEQLEEEKKIALSIRIKPIDLAAMDTDELKAKANELFNITVQLETDKYDYEQKRSQQERDLMELKERQKAQLRQKALKKGLDPEALVGKYPPMIRMYSKYERRTDTRTYDDRKKLYEGGWEVIRAESMDAIWKEKYDEWSKRPSKKLPKWFGERPGKKAGDAPTPEGEEEGGEEPVVEEEEEDYDEEEEEEEEE
jgi:troponin T